uniref:Uncharacterized protein n=1 Tax=Daphnia galeata TaxID=27404 RepID=A0A8J2WM80_9CRUS|nr:unnamed protein product [Daphnia galeata]
MPAFHHESLSNRHEPTNRNIFLVASRTSSLPHRQKFEGSTRVWLALLQLSKAVRVLKAREEDERSTTCYHKQLCTNLFL